MRKSLKPSEVLSERWRCLGRRRVVMGIVDSGLGWIGDTVYRGIIRLYVLNPGCISCKCAYARVGYPACDAENGREKG